MRRPRRQRDLLWKLLARKLRLKSSQRYRANLADLLLWAVVWGHMEVSPGVGGNEAFVVDVLLCGHSSEIISSIHIADPVQESQQLAVAFARPARESLFWGHRYGEV